MHRYMDRKRPRTARQQPVETGQIALSARADTNVNQKKGRRAKQDQTRQMFIWSHGIFCLQENTLKQAKKEWGYHTHIKNQPPRGLWLESTIHQNKKTKRNQDFSALRARVQSTSKRPLGQKLSQLAITAALRHRSARPYHTICTLGGAGQDTRKHHLTPEKTTNLTRCSAQQNRNINGIKYRTVHLLRTLLLTTRKA